MEDHALGKSPHRPTRALKPGREPEDLVASARNNAECTSTERDDSPIWQTFSPHQILGVPRVSEIGSVIQPGEKEPEGFALTLKGGGDGRDFSEGD